MTTLAISWCPAGGFPLINGTFSVPSGAQAGPATVNISFDQGCWDAGAFDPNCRDVVIKTFTVVAGGAATATIGTDKLSYAVGESIQICYTVSQPGRVVITNTPPGGPTQTLLDGVDDGAGDCFAGTAGATPGPRTLELTLYSNGTTPVATAATTFLVVGVTTPTPTTPSPTPSVTPTPTTPTPPSSAPKVIDVTVPSGGDIRHICPEVVGALKGKLGTAANRKLVIVTHGWNGPLNLSEPHTDLQALAGDIRLYLNKKADAADWDVVFLRWSAYANGSAELNPYAARDNAMRIGDCLGQVPGLLNYKYVHLIAHSAGTALIDAATTRMKAQNSTKGIQIHLTMLDAFVPLTGSALSNIGKSADWVDHYYRRDVAASCRPVIILGAVLPNGAECALVTTDRPLPNACNIDTTNLTTPAGVTTPHGGPMAFYRDSVAKPGTSPNDWGFGRAMESTGKSPSLCADGSVGRLKNDRTLESAVFIDIKTRVGSKSSIPSSTVKKSTGTGILEFPGAGVMKIGTGSPVAAEVLVPLDGQFNALQFGFRFTSTQAAEGVLSIELDGQAFWEAIETAGDFDGGTIVLLPGGIPAGPHTLSIRLDNGTADKSVVEISNLTLIDVTFGDEAAPATPPPPDAPRPPATGTGAADHEARHLPAAVEYFAVALLGMSALAVWRTRRP